FHGLASSRIPPHRGSLNPSARRERSVPNSPANTATFNVPGGSTWSFRLVDCRPPSAPIATTTTHRVAAFGSTSTLASAKGSGRHPHRDSSSAPHTAIASRALTWSGFYGVSPQRAPVPLERLAAVPQRLRPVGAGLAGEGLLPPPGQHLQARVRGLRQP